MSTFSLQGYGDLLRAFAARDYRVADFHTANPAQRHLILRHDLDFSLEAVLPLAECEVALGWRATYFVLVRSEMYNIHTPAAVSVLRALQAQGHEIGLHLDASLYGADRVGLEQAASQECAWLEDTIGTAVRCLSFHRPAPSLLDDDKPLAGRVHAYQRRFFRDMGYCSDSRGQWGHGALLDHRAVADGTALQLLTHPIWWAGSGTDDPVAVLDRFRDARDRALAQAIAANCEPYRGRAAKGE